MTLGFSVPLISEHLHISRRTVEAHKNRIVEKVNIKSPFELVTYALSVGLVSSMDLVNMEIKSGASSIVRASATK